jgi:hypothetical protein
MEISGHEVRQLLLPVPLPPPTFDLKAALTSHSLVGLFPIDDRKYVRDGDVTITLDSLPLPIDPDVEGGGRIGEIVVVIDIEVDEGVVASGDEIVAMVVYSEILPSKSSRRRPARRI